MTTQAVLLTGLLVVTLGLFVWGRWKPEVVALSALLVATLLELVPVESAFAGFGHPAVVTVAAILVVSRALATAGLVEFASRPLHRLKKHPILLLAGLTATVAVLSGFINNVGALALMMPVTIRLARDSGRPASMYLMPLAFGSLLGGMTTLIGTPPNLIVSGFRSEATGTPFGFFDFAPVGVAVAAAGVGLLVLVGWRMVPRRKAAVSSEELFQVGEYLTEAKVAAKSPAIGQSLLALSPAEIQVLSIVREGGRLIAPSAYTIVREGDLLVMMGESEAIEKFTAEQKLELAGQEAKDKAKLIESEEIGLAEAVVMPGSRIIGSTAATLRLRDRRAINLLGIAREGARIKSRLADTRFRAGDVLLVQGGREELIGELTDMGCLPLAERAIGLGRVSRRWTALAVFVGAIVCVAAGWVAAPVAFSAAAVLMVLSGVVSTRDAYNAIEWPVLLLLGAMIPVGLAIESSGLAELVSRGTLAASSVMPVWAILGVLLVATMFLSDVVNNAAAAVMMCPIALGLARGLEASADPFLLAVAIGASCAFLTPIGHQSNLLVMGPGGYRFGDYWKLGLVLEAIIVIVAVPALMMVWPPR